MTYHCKYCQLEAGVKICNVPGCGKPVRQRKSQCSMHRSRCYRVRHPKSKEKSAADWKQWKAKVGYKRKTDLVYAVEFQRQERKMLSDNYIKHALARNRHVHRSTITPQEIEHEHTRLKLIRSRKYFRTIATASALLVIM